MTRDLDLTTYKALSFDCYGTLIDWEAGHRRRAGAVGPRAGPRPERRGTAARLRRQRGGRRAGDTRRRSTPRSWRRPSAAPASTLGAPVSDEWARRLGDSVPGLAGVPRLRRRAGPAGQALQADHRVQRAPRRLRRQQPAAARRLRRRSSPPRTSAPTSRPRTTSAPSTPRCPSSAWTAASCCTSPRACSTTTSRPSARGCRRCGSTAATTGPAGARPPSRPRSGPTTSSSPRWPTSPTPSTGLRRHVTATQDDDEQRRLPTLYPWANIAGRASTLRGC